MRALYKRSNANLWLGAQATAQNVVPNSAGLSSYRSGINLDAAELQYRGSSNAAVALVCLLPDSMWTAGQWTDGTTTFTDDTTDAQDAGAGDFALENITNNSDGFMVSASILFGALSINAGTAGISASTEHTISYWNGAWTLMATGAFLKDIPRSAGANWASGENLVLFDPPVDWVVGGTGTGVSATSYNLLVKASVKPTTAGLATRIYVGEVLLSLDQLAGNSAYSPHMSSKGAGVPQYSQGLNGAFSTADGGNCIQLVYHVNG